MGYCALICLLVGFTTLVSGFGTFLPNDTEVIFDYHAVIEAGTVILGKQHDSKFILSAKLHIQSPSDDYLVAQLKGVSYKLFNGESTYNVESHLTAVPLPKDAADLIKPFKITFNKTGQIETFITDKTEKTFARNMHKALASMLQVKTDSIDFTSQVPHSFITNESSIYNQNRTVYNVFPRNDSFIVQKMHDMKSSEHIYDTLLTNIHPLQCDSHYEEPASHESHQTYTFKKQNNSFIPYHIEASGALYFYPFLAKSNTHYVRTVVDLRWETTIPISVQFKIENELVERDLVYSPFDSDKERDLADILNMNHSLDYTTVTSKLQELLRVMDLYWHVNYLDVRTFDIKKSQTVYEMVRLLAPLNLTNLEKIYTEFNGKTAERSVEHMKIFHQLLPLLGSHASIVFISRIIRDRKVDNSVAIHMLQTMSDYVQMPNEKLLMETEHMLSWSNETDSNVQRAAILNFAILLQRTYIYQKRVFLRHSYSFVKEDYVYPFDGVHVSEHVRLFLEKNSIYDKYVDAFGEKFKSAKDLPTQVLYAHALGNSGVPSSVKYLLPIATGNVSASLAIQQTVMNCLAKFVIGSHDKIIEVYWPIFSDWTQKTELRIIAYYLIMRSRPPMSRLLNIHWELQHDPNYEVYNFHYLYLQAVSRTEDPCSEIFKVNVNQLLKFTRVPLNIGYSQYFQTGFVNEDYGYSGEIDVAYISTDNSRSISFDVFTQVANIKTHDYGVYMSIDGLNGELTKLLELNLKEPHNLLNYDKLYNGIKSIPKIKDVEIEISIARGRNILQSYHFNEKNINDLYDIFDIFWKDQVSLKENTIKIYYDSVMHVMIPTEMGMPAYIKVASPTVIHKHINFNKETKNGVSTYYADNMYHFSKNTFGGLSFFNPIVQMHQGVVKKSSFDLVIPIRGHLSYTTQPFGLKVSLNFHEEQQKNMMGVRTHASNHVFADAYIDHKHLTQSCEKCTHWHQITNGDSYRQNETLIYNNGSMVGFVSKVVVFDYESYTKPSNIEAQELGYSSGRMVQYMMDYLRVLYFGALLPSPDTYGYLLTVYPTNEFTFNQIELSLRFSSKLHQQPNTFLPAMKFSPRFTYILKNNEIPLKTWDAGLVFDLNSGHTVQNIKVEIIHQTNSRRDLKICIDSHKRWVKEGVLGHTYIGISENDTCSNDAAIAIDMIGEMYEQQNSPFHIYEGCNMYTHDLSAMPNAVHCAAAHTSIRKYKYDVRMKHMPSEYRNMITNFAFTLFKEYFPYHHYYPTEDSIDLDDSHFKFSVKYLTNDRDVNMKYVGKDYTHMFLGIPAYDLSFFTLYPDNTHYSQLYKFLYNVGAQRECFVETDELQLGVNEGATFKASEMTTEWKYIVGDAKEKAYNGLFVKRLNATSNIMAFRMIRGEHTLEIVPSYQRELFQIRVNGQEISQATDNYHTDWFHYVVRSNPTGSKPHVIVTNFAFRMHMIFVKDRVYLHFPLVNGIEYYGACVHGK